MDENDTDSTDHLIEDVVTFQEKPPIPSEILNTHEMAKRKFQHREAVATMMINGVHMDRIIIEMQERFGITAERVKMLKRETLADWKTTDEEQKPYRRSMAQRRMLNHIAKASKDGKHSAVANLEKTLSEIQGTKEPTDVTSTTDARLSDALFRLIGNLPERKVREIIDREVEMIQLGTTQVRVTRVPPRDADEHDAER